MSTSVVLGQPMKSLTWGKSVTLTLIVMAVGILLGYVVINNLGLFVPPLLPYTLPVYLILWLPVFIVCLILRPSGSKKPLLWLMILGVIMSVVGLAIIGPVSNYTSGVCQPAPLPEQPVRYECQSQPNYQGLTDNYILQGSEGSPFVRVIDVR